jgi:tRNA modification GTPase
MQALADIIVAISTAPGAAGISVVRVSGPGSLALADAAFRGTGPLPSARPSHTIHHGYVVDTAGRAIDEVLLLIMRAPRSFTGEDVVEFHCHGGHMSATRTLRRLVECGARPAEPGEFTRRAFLNGKIDLTQAEAVLDLIRASSERAAAAALSQLQGHLRDRIDTLRRSALDISAHLEASLDFPEDELPPVGSPSLVQSLRHCADACRSLAASCREGRMLRDGIKVVIAGRPNAGKSSLFNRLLGDARAIVSAQPGTTRDTIEEWITIDGYGIRLVDTAGIGPSDCTIEQEGVRRSKMHVAASDFILYVMDATIQIEDVDYEILASVDRRRVLIVRNKIDLGGEAPMPPWVEPYRVVRTSCSENVSIQHVTDVVLDMIREDAPPVQTSAPTVSERHRLFLDSAAGSFLAAAEILCSGREDQTVLACSHVRSGAEDLGAILGTDYDEDLLDRIFSRFCIGK